MQINTRKDKIMALLPPPTSDLDDSSDDDMEINFNRDSDSDTSEAPSLPQAVAEVMEHVTADISSTDSSSEHSIFEKRTPLRDVLLHTPQQKTVFTPLKTRLQSTKNATEERGNNDKENQYIETEDLVRNNVRKQKKRKNEKKVDIDYKWSTEEFEFPVNIPDDNFTMPNELRSPYEYFKIFFSHDIIDLTVENTNLYSTQETGKSVNVTEDEIRDFIAIQTLMGMVDMPSYLDYWSQRFRYEEIAEVMSLKRYQQIRRYIYFVNNRN